MYKIGEFSAIGKVSVRMLRHYDQMGLLKPIDIDIDSGYRSYSIEQLPKLNRIIFLKELGFSLQEIKEYLEKDMSVEEMKSMLFLKRREIEDEIALMHYKLHKVSMRLEQMENEGKPPKYDISVKSTERMVIASLVEKVPHIQEMAYYCEKMYGELYEELKRINIKPKGNEITIYHNKEFTETNLNMEAGVIIDEKYLSIIFSEDMRIKIREIPATENSAYLYYTGSYSGMEPAIMSMLGWVGQNNLKIKGPLVEIHLSGPAHVDNVVQQNAVVEFRIEV